MSNQKEEINEGYTPFSEIPYTTCAAVATVQSTSDNNHDHDHAGGYGNDEGAMFTFAQSAPAPVEDGYHYGFIDQDSDDDDYDETQPHEETFYANGNHDENSTNDNIGRSAEEEKISKELQEQRSAEGEQIISDSDAPTEFDFSSLADQALQSLEMEYTQTIQSEQELEVQVEAVVSPSHDHADQQPSPDEAAASMADCQQEDDDSSPPRTQIRTKPMPDIDAAAVTKAMQNIALSAPNLEHKLSNWKPSHPSYAHLTIPSIHPIIPSNPLMAFTRHTRKAHAASANLSRSATLADSMCRLFITPANAGTNTNTNTNTHTEYTNFVYNQDEIFVIHCIGADRVECQSTDTIRKAVGPFVKWMHQYQHFEHGIGTDDDIDDDNDDNDVNEGSASLPHCQSSPVFQWPKHVRIEMLGPNVPPHAEQFGVLNLLPRTPGRLESATVVCRSCMYHDHLQSLEDANDSDDANPNDNVIDIDIDDEQKRNVSISMSLHYPNLVIAYNAGIWGYTDWHPTLKKLYEFERTVPFVITAYTIFEAEDDFEVLEEVLGVSLADDGNGRRCLWSAELNAFASRVVRETKSSDNTYFENGAWQAYVMGKIQ
eukprot:scaffold360_cov262-Chaetoceros_neogracile.AAC.2